MGPEKSPIYHVRIYFRRSDFLHINYFVILLCTFQGQSACEYWLKRGLSALERYFFLILFNAYLHEQVRAKEYKENFTRTTSNKACVAGTRKLWV